MNDFEQLHPRNPQGKFVEKNMPSSSGVELKEDAIDIGFDEYCKDHLYERLDEMEGQRVYASDLVYEIMEPNNVDGSMTYSTYKAQEFVFGHSDVAGEYWQYQKDELGEIYQNPFDNPEAYMVGMVEAGVRNLCSNSDFLDEHWDQQIELDEKTIETIKQEVAPYSAFAAF